MLSDEEIVLRARPVFLEEGYRVGTRELAAAVGLTWPALVARFGGKRELFARAIAEPACARLEFERLADRSDLRTVLNRLSAMLEERWLMRLHYRLATGNGAPADDSDALVAPLVSAIERCASTGDAARRVTAEDLARVASALLVGEIVLRFTCGDEASGADPDLIDVLATQLVRVIPLTNAQSDAGRHTGNDPYPHLDLVAE